MIRFEPSPRVERNLEPGLLGRDHAQPGWLVREPVSKRNTLVAGSQLDFNRGVVRVAKRQATAVQELVHPRRAAGEQLVGFPAAFNRAGPVKRKPARKILVLALQAQRRTADHSAVHVSLDTEFRSGDTSWVHVRIQDKGDGFNPGSLQNATKPFFGTKTVGLGLGLTVCQRIIEMHQGKLFLDNTANGITSTIRISLPLDAAPAPGQETAKASAN